MIIIKNKAHKPEAGYVGAVFDAEQQKVIVWERDTAGKRVPYLYDAPYYFYVPDEEGDQESIFGHKVRKVVCADKDEHYALCKKNKVRFESDFNPLDRVLMDHYYGVDVPKLHSAFIDIEVDYDPEKGFSSPENPYAPINAITIYKQWKDEYVTIAVPPPGVWPSLVFPDRTTWPTEISLEDIGSDVKARLHIVENERDLLELTLKEIENADVLSGWNSDFFDMPYLTKRTQIALGEREFGNWSFRGAPKPRYKTTEQYGSERTVVELYGRNHLDYLQLFQKFTFEGRASYSLGAIAEEELSIPKLDYEGTLYDLYRNDFLHFIKYNIRDVEVIHRLDEKFKFISLANMMSHENTTLLGAVLGTVKYVETGITNYAHNVLKKIVGDKSPVEDTEKVEGAIVLTPKVGLHMWIGSVDINSLYPSVIRALNISPEKIIGQFANGERDWNGIRAKDDRLHMLRLEDGSEVTFTGEQWKLILAEHKWAVSAYGTVFDQSAGKGLVPIVLEDWYFGRKKLQAEKKKWTKIRKTMEDEGKEDTPEYVDACKQEEYYDLLQLTRKIQLNSTYGALLNAFFRFFRTEMGASVTATGRAITSHMIGTIGELLTGQYSHLTSYTKKNKDGTTSKFYETAEDSPVIYGDTDSSYFKTYATNKEEAVEVADTVAEGVNASFPGFMKEAFNCQEPAFHNLIKTGREIVGIRGLFQAKKKYMIKVVDLEGVATDKMKSMGSEIKKADTPKPIQKFLKNTVDMILDGKEYNELETFVNTERKRLFSKKSYADVISLGVARSANNLESQYEDYQRTEKRGKGKVRLPGHIRAAIMYNELVQEFEGAGAKLVQSGDKVKVFYLLNNPYKIKSIAFPSDIAKFPKWFDEHFKVDIPLTEQKMIDAKLEGIFEAWGHEVPTIQGAFVKSIVQF